MIEQKGYTDDELPTNMTLNTKLNEKKKPHFTSVKRNAMLNVLLVIQIMYLRYARTPVKKHF